MNDEDEDEETIARDCTRGDLSVLCLGYRR